MTHHVLAQVVRTVGGRNQAVIPGKVTVVSFVNSKPASQHQLAVLKSMQEQFGARALIIVAPVDRENPVNLYFDWNLGGIRVAADGPTLARDYGVKTAPVTFLVSARGLILDRIEGIADAPRLAFPLHGLLPSASPSPSSHNERHNR